MKIDPFNIAICDENGAELLEGSVSGRQISFEVSHSKILRETKGRRNNISLKAKMLSEGFL